jgi:hypothetical protein
LTEVFASTEAFAAGVAAAGSAETFAAGTPPETEAAGPPADRLAAPVPERRVAGVALAPVAARVGLGTGLPAGAVPGAVLPGAALPLSDTSAACAPVAASDAFVLLVVTAVILALLRGGAMRSNRAAQPVRPQLTRDV